MRWLITGGCGFIGSNLADHLLRDGEDVILLDNLYRDGSRENRAWLRERHTGGFLLLEEDVRHAETIAKVVKDMRPDVIAHLAGQVAMTTSLANPRLDFEVNAGGTFNVMEAVRLYSPRTVVLYSSTNKVYGSLEHLRIEERETRYSLPDFPLGFDETMPQDGLSPYGCSKLAADQYVRDYSRMYGIATVVFRHSSVYGGRQFATYDQGWIGWFCRKSLEAAQIGTGSFSIHGNGKQVRDALHVDDAVAAYRSAASHIAIVEGKIFNIGGGIENSLSLLELFRLLEGISGHPMSYDQLDWRLGDQKVFVADTRSAQKAFGWSPRIGVERGIRQTVDWAREAYGHE